MRRNPRNSLLMAGFLAGVSFTSPSVLAQTHGFSQQQPSAQDIERFCGNWGQLSGSEQEQYREQYERYCRDEPVFGQPVAPEPQTTIMQPAEPQPPSSQQQQPQEPQQPVTPEEPEPAEPEPQIRPTKPKPEPLRVDLVGRLELVGPLARSPGERQRLRVTVENPGPGGGPHAPAVNRLWARVFLSEREVSRRGASAGAFAFAGTQRGQPVRLPGLPGPGRSREAMVEVPLPATLEEGNYWWCVQVDSRQAIEETEEGNNTACARKVVAIGRDRDAGPEELSSLFGSKVDEIRGLGDVGQQAAGGPTHPGLLRQSELDRMAALLTKTGGASYEIFTGRAGSGLTRVQKRGLMLLRRPQDLVRLRGEYYSDGRGNLVRFGAFEGPDGGMPYALSLFAGGGMNLVVDTDRDGIVDAGVSGGLKEQFGFLARPGMDHILECMKRSVSTGDGAKLDLRECLSGGASDQNGSNGAGFGGSGDGLGSVLKPECGAAGSKLGSVGFTNPADTPDHLLEKTRNWAVGNVEWHETLAEEARSEGNGELARAHSRAAEKARDLATKSQQALDTERGSSERGEAVEKVNDAYDDLKEAQDYARAVDEADRDRESSGGKEMPGPGPGGIAGPGGNDPRCEEPSIWNRLHSERCASNMADCLKRMSDPIYAATGGRCETVTGPDDAERVECKGNDSVARCIEGGGSPQKCAEKHSGDPTRGGQGENDDIFGNNNQGSGNYALLDVHPFGATLAAMCRKAGGIGPCGDSSPVYSAPVDTPVTEVMPR